VERRPLIVVNDHTEARQMNAVMRRLASGQRIAVVTDAGMPGISDPGERLVRAALRHGHAVEVVPGPTAAIAALVASGLATGRFVFEGFLPRRGAARAERLDELSHDQRTLVLYEAPHRLARTLEDVAGAFGADRPVAVARELTKLHEEMFRGTIADAVEWALGGTRGEVVIVVEGAPEPPEPTDDELRTALARALKAGDSVRTAATAVASATGASRRRVYDLARSVRDEDE
jgi:16S rRNA (cytidine1402-2'-O)-methyltransferase